MKYSNNLNARDLECATRSRHLPVPRVGVRIGQKYIGKCARAGSSSIYFLRSFGDNYTTRYGSNNKTKCGIMDCIICNSPLGEEETVTVKKKRSRDQIFNINLTKITQIPVLFRYLVLMWYGVGQVHRQAGRQVLDSVLNGSFRIGKLNLFFYYFYIYIIIIISYKRRQPFLCLFPSQHVPNSARS